MAQVALWICAISTKRCCSFSFKAFRSTASGAHGMCRHFWKEQHISVLPGSCTFASSTMNAKSYIYIHILRRNSTIYCHPSLDYYILHTSCHSCNQLLLVQYFFFIWSYFLPIYLQSMPSIDPLRPIVHTLCFSWSASAMASKASCPRAVTSQHLQPGSSVPKGSIPAKYLQDPPGSNALISS